MVLVDTWLGSLNSKTITLYHSTRVYFNGSFSSNSASFGIFIAYKKYARKFDLEKPELEVGFVGRKLYGLMSFMIFYLLKLQKQYLVLLIKF